MKTRKSKRSDILLARIQQAHAFILSNPDCGSKELCAHMDLADSSVRYAIYSLRDSGHIIVTPGKRSKQGQQPNTYRVVIFAAPKVIAETAVARKKRVEKMQEPDKCVKRKFTKAQQLGMVRDELIAALFGGAGRVVT